MNKNFNLTILIIIILGSILGLALYFTEPANYEGTILVGVLLLFALPFILVFFHQNHIKYIRYKKNKRYGK